MNSGPAYPLPTRETRRPPPPWTPPSRSQMLDALKASSRSSGDEHPEEFDLLIVGGGATGAGVAVDAASRGLKVALVVKLDELLECAVAVGDLDRFLFAVSVDVYHSVRSGLDKLLGSVGDAVAEVGPGSADAYTSVRVRQRKRSVRTCPP